MNNKAAFMEKLSSAGFEPINEKGCIMVTSDSKLDINLVQTIADRCGYDGSYGWRLKTNKPAPAVDDDAIKNTVEKTLERTRRTEDD